MHICTNRWESVDSTLAPGSSSHGGQAEFVGTPSYAAPELLLSEQESQGGCRSIPSIKVVPVVCPLLSASMCPSTFVQLGHNLILHKHVHRMTSTPSA